MPPTGDRGVMKNFFVIIVLLLSLTVGYFYGLYSHRDYLPPYPQLLEIKNHLFPLSIGFTDVSGKTALPCARTAGKRSMVALVFGQSNSGNHGETLYRPARPVYNFFKGRCYKAEDPLLGPTGDRGTVWSRLGDLLIARGLYDSVIFIPIGVGTTTIDQWTEGGYLHRRIINAIRESSVSGLRITHLFWVQGGSEKRTRGDAANKEAYKKNFMAMLKRIRENGVDAPIFVAPATYSHAGVNPDIREAQLELADPKRGIYTGADNDILYQNRENRWETVHLSHRGLELCARAWLDAILKAEGPHAQGRHGQSGPADPR